MTSIQRHPWRTPSPEPGEQQLVVDNTDQRYKVDKIIGFTKATGSCKTLFDPVQVPLAEFPDQRQAMNDIRRLEANKRERRRKQVAHDRRYEAKQARLKKKFGKAYKNPSGKSGMFASYRKKQCMDSKRSFEASCREAYEEAEQTEGTRKRKCTACSAWNARHPHAKQLFPFMHNTSLDSPTSTALPTSTAFPSSTTLPISAALLIRTSTSVPA
ncbi:hypothetical protein CF319_g8607 [Tilletia indica]|nr:hypothetical protein CF319_g8607 [Tilletia indica]